MTDDSDRDVTGTAGWPCRRLGVHQTAQTGIASVPRRRRALGSQSANERSEKSVSGWLAGWLVPPGGRMQ